MNQRAPAVSIHHYVSPTPEQHCVTSARIMSEDSTEAVSLFAGDALIATTTGMAAPLGIALCRQLGLVPRPRVSFDDVRREYAEASTTNDNAKR